MLLPRFDCLSGNHRPKSVETGAQDTDAAAAAAEPDFNTGWAAIRDSMTVWRGSPA